ncbi:hypothetical protein GCM10007916_26730 [Psychromonas marina]|uniref:Uncharacterized protein n=1 Tax=Psychromonas marina TaxID=88364 RepID=A0ABQ6E2H3_9GAMM|nr:hypothetical protein [Psychromonas marina]GLS91604.1 hypothetical protein GCM10007916_26730 [Psychromonas marina]
MTEYIIIAIIMVFIYFVLVRNRPAAKTDWESLPTLSEYQKIPKAHNSAATLCCQYCGHTEMIKRVLNSKKENASQKKHYHACTKCKVILWRSEEA